MGDVLCFWPPAGGMSQTASVLAPSAGPPARGAPGPDCLVSVPGQTFWHTHTCRKCHSSWTHIAPTPMTQAKNQEIHTCTKCGELVYEFVRLDAADPVADGLPWLAGGILAGVALAVLLDRG